MSIATIQQRNDAHHAMAAILAQRRKDTVTFRNIVEQDLFGVLRPRSKRNRRRL